ncbi:MAG: VWA domain-containing protein [Cyanobacteria bacterium J06639_14]
MTMTGLQVQPIDSHWASQVTTLCYVVSDWDREQWHQYVDSFPQVKSSLQSGKKRMQGWELFAEEIFHRLLTVPQPIPYEQLRPEVLWAHQLHQLIDESVDFGEMQIDCRNNKLAAGHGTYRLMEIALSTLPRPPRGFNPKTMEDQEAKCIKLQAQLKALEQTRDQLQREFQSASNPQRRQALQENLDQVDFDYQQIESQLQQAQQKMGKLSQTAQAHAEQVGESLANIFMDAIREALDSVTTFHLSMNAFGWGDGIGILNHPGNTQKKEQVAQRLSNDKRFRRIAEAAGRFQAIAALRQGAKRSKQIPDELADSTRGNNFARLMPSEWIRAAIAELRPLFLKDYADESLIESDFDGATDDGEQGPVIICLDKSGSMDEDDGKKEIDSTALMLALISIAQQQKRNARVILFDGQVRHIRDLDPYSATHADRLDLADLHYGGGTDFMAPLERALEGIEKTPDLKEADVIFITDGEADVEEEFSSQWREAQKEMGFKVYTLIVGTYIDVDVLKRFSDQNIFVKDLEDPAVHQVFDI